ncbi:MAG: glycosyltransferase family 2 protein [Chloroflexi bacterium]|nr:glycosyltransferase family 2 protein [Chloroflexota bacterium]
MTAVSTAVASAVSSQNERPLLSIIIPAYNEEQRLPGSLENILAWKKSVPYEIEVLIVENGSQDRTTEVAESFARSYEFVHVLHSDKGKGAAVREGMIHGSGDYLFICDSDLSMPISEVEKFLPPQLQQYDVAIGSREAPGAVRYNEPEYRHIMGRAFNLIVRLLAVPGFHDTQCGFKMFKRDVAQNVFARQTITGWTFDVEALYLAIKSGAHVVEVPIHWYFDADSRVDPIRDTWQMFWDVIRIRVNDLRGRYDQPPPSPPASEHTVANR